MVESIQSAGEFCLFGKREEEIRGIALVVPILPL